MSRVQLALNVSDVDEAVAFYSKLFQTEPAKRRPGYANFAIAEPPLKLVLIENADATERLNHLGVEVESTDQIATITDRVTDKEAEQVTCCFAVQDKTWIEAPDGAWEVYTVLADADVMKPGADDGAVCCATDVTEPVESKSTVNACC
jgi:catechol 2,3-dioxygenase-like lactoylglutathione lyase family enzyme